MLIGDVARRSGVSAKALRYYEDIGLLAPPEREPSGYRHYDADVLDRLRFIQSAQALGLSLGEIRGIVALRDDGQAPCGHVLELLRVRSSEIGRTIRELRTLQTELKRLVARARHLDPEACDPQRVCHLIGPPGPR
jgi:DNA-binding transcriptional MerR regulator